MKNKKKSFTLIELSVVIVIIAIMLSTVLVSRSLINSSKANKIYEEYRNLRNAVTMFYNQYSCYAGDCPDGSINDIKTSLGSLYSTCTTAVTAASSNGAYIDLGSSLIHSASKRTCMFAELQIAGYMNAVPSLNVTATGTTALNAHVLGANLPASGSTGGVWDFRAISANGAANKQATATPTSVFSSPFELGLGSTATTFPSNTSVHYAVVRGNDATPTDVSVYGSAANTSNSYVVSPVLANKIDSKFDDGKPYSGSIVGGSKGYSANPATNDCNSAASPYTAANITSSVTYNSGTGTGSSVGCLLAFAVPTPA